MTEMPYLTNDPKIQSAYESMRSAGLSHNLAEMFAYQQPPMSNTDREFLQGHVNGNQFSKTPEVGDYLKSVAVAGGTDPTGKVYVSGLAAYPGDPRAWVSGRGDVAQVVRERGWDCSGSVTVNAREIKEEPKAIDVAPDIVEEVVQKRLAQDPGLAEKDPGELRHETKCAIRPHWCK